MTDSDQSKLAAFLREVSNWNWEEFCKAESDPQYTTNQAVIFALIRACVMEKMDAIKLALNRIDGKLKTPVRIEMPKVFYRYPMAQLPPEDHSKKQNISQLLPTGDASIGSEAVIPEAEPEPELATLSLRQTLSKMADHPRQVPEAIIAYATATQKWLNGTGPMPDEKPLVKSVVAAHLLKLAQERNIDALSEVFDQVDGKLVETIQVLGEDICITDYSLTAPDGAYLGPDGVLRMEAVQAQDIWAQKLGNRNG
jgi:hypothetical protein